MSSRERRDDKAETFTNVYIKNFPESVDEEKLKEMFGAFGTIVSAKMMTSDDGRAKGYGFVCFKDHKAAAKVS